jgi:hypothetical protein
MKKIPNKDKMLERFFLEERENEKKCGTGTKYYDMHYSQIEA